MKISTIWKQLNLKKKVLLLFLPLNVISILMILVLSISLLVHNGKKEMMQNSMDKLILVCDQADRIVSNVKYNIKAFSTSSALQTAICTSYPDNTYGSYMSGSYTHLDVYKRQGFQRHRSLSPAQRWNCYPVLRRSRSRNCPSPWL